MKTAVLEAFGVEDRILKLWNECGFEELLPVQNLAIQKGKVLDGKNAVIFSPTSSGKTFVGEMAAIRTARQNRRVIYLVPQKALAEEKFQEFQRRYRPLGVRVVISTRDRKEYDRDIRRGRFHIAVIVFEKMHALLVSCPTLLRNIGLVVLDELQMLGDEFRGPALEILLTKVILAPDRPQIICLSAVLGNAQGLANWLGAALCEEHQRPVELRKGVLYQGQFRYLEHNSGRDGTELLCANDGHVDRLDILVNQVQTLVERGEQCLVLCKSKQECMRTAKMIANLLPTVPAKSALVELNELEDSEGKDQLASLLQRRVAYHNADLDWDQRELIERGFRQSEIMVVCATTTLAMGVNLPARNVLIDPERWERDRTGSWLTVPISQAEYENISGRAGRLGLEKDFGRAIIVAESEFEEATFYDAFVKGELESLKPALANGSLSRHVLNLIASKMCRQEDQIRQIMLASYTGTLYWQGPEKEAKFTEKLHQAIQRCLAGGLLAETDKGLEVTELGKLAAAKGLSVDTAIAMAKFAEQSADAASTVDLFEVLWCLTGTKDGKRVHINLSTAEFNSGEYRKRLGQVISSLPDSAKERMSDNLRCLVNSYSAAQRIKKALMLYEWIQGLPTRRIEIGYHCYSGSLYSLSGEFAWLSEAMAGIVKVCGWTERDAERLGLLSGQLIHGVTAEALALTDVRLRGFRRGRIMALVARGWNDLKKILETPLAELQKLLTRPVTERLLRHASRELEKAQITAPAKEKNETEPQSDNVGETEVAEWDKEYSAADELGTNYQSEAMIHLDGQAKKQRYLIRINDKEIWVTLRSFETALRFAIAAKEESSGWVNGRDLSFDNYHQVIRRLKKDLQIDGVDLDKLIENNGAKHYRFSVPPVNISWNEEKIRRHAKECQILLNKGQ